jgi:hypothetical protein
MGIARSAAIVCSPPSGIQIRPINSMPLNLRGARRHGGGDRSSNDHVTEEKSRDRYRPERFFRGPDRYKASKRVTFRSRNGFLEFVARALVRRETGFPPPRLQDGRLFVL